MGVTYRYALLEDDEIWRSSFGVHPLGAMAVSIMFLGGGVLGGAVVGLILFAVITRIQKKGMQDHTG
jgi:hypothetical protein